ncbi:terminase TerL endonuclease subunit [Niveispirillum sp.]|uniref:terminase large subunit n=1 Tax=Niveispirillum sp. TaxID=1917217 RepID=UPI001B689652|nr:terminase TerL endonuclease subunit [Niveispirillum sp.]MBP7339103.1 terminase large subunit [Niveispirillum sp.]
MSIDTVASPRKTPPMPLGGEAMGAWFDHDAADAAVDFFHTYLCHTEAEWYGKPFRLAPWQEHDIIRPIFGWKRADGTRLIRQAYIEIPRKNGKTELAAGVSLLALVADGELGGQGYSMAKDKDQAKIVFNKAGVMATLNPVLSDLVEVYKTSLYCGELAASFKPLSSSPGSKHGFSPSFAVADELHEWPDGELHDVVHKGTAARRQPLEILITTAGQPNVGYGWELHEYAEEVQKGNVIDPTFHAVIYAADAEDDWTSPETWAKANPNYGVSVKPDYLASEVAKARGNTRKQGDFKRYHLNIWNDQVAGGLPMDEWDAMPVRSVTLETLKGRPCWGGLDLASKYDLSALVLVSADDNDGYDVWCRFWMPEHRIRERSREDKVDYDKWMDQGWIVATEGNVIDYDVIRGTISGWRPEKEALAEMVERLSGGANILRDVQLEELAIDEWNAVQLLTQLKNDKVNCFSFGQGFKSMSEPSKELERLIMARKWNHGGNPVLRWMAGCTTYMADPAENVKPVKPNRKKSKKRIDGIVASTMALGRAMVKDPAPQPEQVWAIAC